MTRSPFEITRRDVLKALPLTALAACTPRPYRRGDFNPPARSRVALMPGDELLQGSCRCDLFAAWNLLRPNIAGRSVLLKPNLVEYEAGTIINTNPSVIVGAAEAFLRYAPARS
jgi:hypothetical protein